MAWSSSNQSLPHVHDKQLVVPELFDGSEAPLYTQRDQWPRPPAINVYPGVDKLPARCLQPTLPSNETNSRAPNGAITGACFQLNLRGPDETQPVLPTIFIPGFPKSATTWLFDCMHVAFRPETVCPPQSSIFDPTLWSKLGCQHRRYLLPGIWCNVLGGCMHRKELFFFGGGFANYFNTGLAGLHGPELPLEMFLAQDQRFGGRWTQQVVHDAVKLQRLQGFCTHPNHTHLPAGRVHPSCCTSVASVPKRWECRWHEQLRQKHGRVKSMYFQNAMPWVKPKEFDFASIDATPNYMCTPSALFNIKRIASNPSNLRFIVVMRDPIMRAFSEWAMFALGWGWDKEPNFLKRMRSQMASFRACNETLFHRNDIVRGLPDEELFTYVNKCFRGKAMEYITNSIYPVCVLAALRVFPRDQFLFLRFEDLMRLKAPALVRLLANFTGLYTDDAIIDSLQRRGHCEAGSAKKVPLSFGKDSRTMDARQVLGETMGEFEAFFKPYDELLQELVHPEFVWTKKTHLLSADKLRNTSPARKVADVATIAAKAAGRGAARGNVRPLRREDVARGGVGGSLGGSARGRGSARERGGAPPS